MEDVPKRLKSKTSSEVKKPSNKNRSFVSEFRKHNINLPSLLLIFYAIPINMSVSDCQGIISELFSTYPDEDKIDPHIIWWFQSVVIYCLHPIAGWIADTKIGRGKTITMSLWFCWCGSVVQVVSYCIQYSFVESEKCELYMALDIFARFVLSIIALVLFILGIASYQSNILAYGMDQLPDASTNQIRKFVRWLTWSFFVGFFFNYLTVVQALTQRTAELNLGTFFATFIFISVALILHGCLRHKFYASGTVKRNPYSTVIKVLKYAWKHKVPQNRSALTYWENEVPSRIDLSKDKYGGPLPEGDVEDTKTFWRMVAVFCSLGGVFIPYFTVERQGVYYAFQFIDPKGTKEENSYSAYILWQALFQVSVVCIPLFDLIIVPLFPKIEYFLIESFKGFIMATVLLLLALAGILTLEGVAIGNNDYNSTCYLTIDVLHDTEYLDLSYLYFIIPWFFVGITYLIVALKSFEFICSQAPNEMSGMLTGVYWFIRSCYISVGVVVTLILSKIDKLPILCTFLVITVHLVICLAFLIILAVVSKWYRNRQRRKEFPVHNVVEDHYNKFVSSSYYTGFSKSQLFSKYDLPVNGWSDNTIPVYPSKN